MIQPILVLHSAIVQTGAPGAHHHSHDLVRIRITEPLIPEHGLRF